MRLSLLAAVPLAAAAATGGFELCNGHAELCSRPYDNITFVGAHNSPFVGYFPSHNQNIAVAEQLALGVRFLQAQTRDKDGSPQLCHSHCLLEDAGPLGGLLETVKTFLDANPAEVVTLLLTNHGGFPGTAFGDVFREVGLESYAFVPAEGGSALGQWPTLGDMIVSGKRLVVFMAADYPLSPYVPYILDEFGSFMVETPFEYDDLNELTTCPIDRPEGSTTENRMLLMNHWLQKNLAIVLIPDRCMATTTNSEPLLMRHVQSCEASWQRTPNFILLDWLDLGDGMRVQDLLNGLEPEQDAIEPGTPVEGCLEDLGEKKRRRRRSGFLSGKGRGS